MNETLVMNAGNFLDQIIQQITEKQPVESFILLTDAERLILKNNQPVDLVQKVSVTREKLLTIYKLADIPKKHAENLEITYEKAVELEKELGFGLIYTSVYRSKEHHKRIYDKINEIRLQQKLKPLPIPELSKHLFFQAVDCKPHGQKIKVLHDAVRDERIMKKIKIWGEALEHTPQWFHWQTVQYGSWSAGKSMFFNIKK